ncbi:MAG: hypothetical protein BZY88_00705 [SAR202 cluster bacterium Io17-Chloro-G9]|nr:MAG: hypothetical protein BZY88_00705 [SAR202 cluster bacterium Io17-Chloro-G9]
MVSISFEKVTLSNGLDVILHQDHSIPLVAVNVWYHVGSKDEEMGRTGFAHLFEHLMFEGSKHHNSSHFEPLQKAGANLNGSTTPDRTNYWEDVPSNYLELALWLEADRMGFLLDALDQQRFDVQRDVVKNERRQSYENRPYGMASWHIQEALFPMPHPYHWMTIGSQEDLDAATLEDTKNFFRRFYAASNSSLAIAGDFQREEAMDLVNRYFGDLPPGPALPRKGRHDSPLAGRVELEMRDRVSLPRVYMSWPTPAAFHADDVPLELLQAVLSDGISSRLHRELVYKQQIAQSVDIRYHAGEIAGQFQVVVTAAAGEDLAKVEAAADAELARLRQEPPTDEEIASVKNRIEASHYRQLAHIGGFGGRADQLNHFNTLAVDPDLINTSLDQYMAVNRDEIVRVAESLFDGPQVRMRVLPEKALSPSIVTVDRWAMPAAAKEPVFTPPTPQRSQLSNGLSIALVEKRGMPLVCFGLYLEGGAITDSEDQPGLAGITAQMLAEGTETRSSQEIAAAFESIGSRVSTDAQREYAFLTSDAMTKHWPAALDLLADLVKNPAFPDHELERLRREHLTDLRRGLDDAGVIAARISPGLVFPQHTGYGHPVSGTEESVSAMTRQDILEKFRRDYGPASATLIVAGDVTMDEVYAQAEAHLGSWSGNGANGNVPGEADHHPFDETTIYLVDRPGAAQSVIRAVQPTINRHHPDYFALTLLNYSFGGQFSARLNSNLRQDKGYSYGYNSSVQWHRGPSLLQAGGSVQTAVTKESVQETLKEFSDIHGSRPVTQEELDASKAGILLGYPAGFERPSMILGHLLQLVQYRLPNDYFQTVRSQLDAVSLADVHRVAAEQIRPSNLKVLVVGDREAVEPGLRELGLPLVMLDLRGNKL